MKRWYWVIIFILPLLSQANDDCTGNWTVRFIDEQSDVRPNFGESAWIKAYVEVGSSLRQCASSVVISAKSEPQFWLKGPQGRIALQFFDKQSVPLTLVDSRSVRLNLEQSKLTYFWLKIPQGTFLSAGQYSTSVDVQLISSTHHRPISTQTKNIHYYVKPFASMKLDSSRYSWMRSTGSYHQVMLGHLKNGLKRQFDFQVLSNTNVTMKVEPEYGELKHVDAQGSIPYYLLVNRQRVKASKHPVSFELGRMSARTPSVIPFGIEVGSTRNAIAGNYREVLKVSVIARP
ncbi:hypothetical protein [Photobacterium rosenbergii]|uniref:Uncharacterized protein n=1 Tax=Photobacterium rosenbergii TaxID=294936 RepID=A0ABU3ZJV0_9GAMM|nr:hypothetical protein [Photobacterium rosenbergii]MDV5170399.1 hypothetical protein [Photobacterium rosenbergii]